MKTIITESFKQRLTEVMSVQSKSYKTKQMHKYIKRVLKEIDGVSFYSKDGNLYAVKGILGKDEYYPCCVSHTDTVHDFVKDFRVIEVDDWLYAMDYNRLVQTGIGGDDKVGIFLCLEMLRRFDTIKVAFFRDEEVGCVGSGVADMSFFQDVGYVFQTDRKGNSDFVTDISGELSSNDFQDYIESTIKKFGYSFTNGGLTDVDQLKSNGLNVCVANMSSGYYRPHTDEEIVSIRDVYNVVSMVENLISLLGCEIYEHTRPERTYGSYYGRDWYWGSYWDKTTDEDEDDETQDTRCPECHHEIVGEYNANWCYNDNCIVNDTTLEMCSEYCEECDDLLYKNDTGSTVCLSCYYEKIEKINV